MRHSHTLRQMNDKSYAMYDISSTEIKILYLQLEYIQSQLFVI